MPMSNVVTICHITRRICFSMSSSSAATEKKMASPSWIGQKKWAQHELFRSNSACYKANEKVTILPSSKSNILKHANATMPRNVTSFSMVTSDNF